MGSAESRSSGHKSQASIKEKSPPASSSEHQHSHKELGGIIKNTTTCIFEETFYLNCQAEKHSTIQCITKVNYPTHVCNVKILREPEFCTVSIFRNWCPKCCLMRIALKYQSKEDVEKRFGPMDDPSFKRQKHLDPVGWKLEELAEVKRHPELYTRRNNKY